MSSAMQRLNVDGVLQIGGSDQDEACWDAEINAIVIVVATQGRCHAEERCTGLCAEDLSGAPCRTGRWNAERDERYPRAPGWLALESTLEWNYQRQTGRR